MKRRIYRDLDAYFRDSGDTQADFAARLGVSQPAISLIRNGKRTPSLRLAKRIAEAARIPVETLISGPD